MQSYCISRYPLYQSISSEGSLITKVIVELVFLIGLFIAWQKVRNKVFFYTLLSLYIIALYSEWLPVGVATYRHTFYFNSFQVYLGDLRILPAFILSIISIYLYKKQNTNKSRLDQNASKASD